MKYKLITTLYKIINPIYEKVAKAQIQATHRRYKVTNFEIVFRFKLGDKIK